MMGLRHVGSWCGAVVLVGLVACTGDDDADVVETVSMLVGPAGGTLEMVSGAKVTIPPGALSVDTTIKITKLPLDTVASLPSNLEASGKPYAFEPHGTVFSVPVKIDVPFDGDATEVRPMKLPDENGTMSDWTTVFPNEKAAGKVSMDTTSFSVVLAARPRRITGVITLPDGAVVPEDAGAEDAQIAGSGGMAGGGAGIGGAGVGGTAGVDGAGVGGMAGVDGAGVGGTAGVDGAGVGGTGGDPVVDGGAGDDDDAGGAGSGGVSAQDASVESDAGIGCGGCDAGESCEQGACVCPLANQCLSSDTGGDHDAGAGDDNFVCRDLDSDRHNCGACGLACDIGEICVDGSCALLTCDAPLIRCGNECVDPEQAANHCGGCGVPERPGQDEWYCYIEDSFCRSECTESGGSLCPWYGGSYYDYCVDLLTDRAHCGACDVGCSENEACVMGSCEIPTCGEGQVACSGMCVHGESCGIVCGSLEACDGGSCGCAPGITLCPYGEGDGEFCADLQNDSYNCGDCDYWCDSGESCVQGQCACAGDSPEYCSNGEYTYCTDTSNDDYNCGGCFNSCNQSQVCVGGDCVCSFGRTDCEGFCVDTESNPFHCGSCFNSCDLQGDEQCTDGICHPIE